MSYRLVVTAWLVSAVMGAGVALAAPGSDAPAPAGQPAAQPPTSIAQVLEQIRSKKEAGTLKANPVAAKQANDLLETILTQDPTNVEAHLLAGEILVDASQMDAARSHFVAVLDVEPNNFRANLGYGQILIANRSWRQATNYLERADRVASDPKRAVEVKRALSIACAGMGNLDQAIEQITAATRIDPGDLDALQTAAEIRLESAKRDPRQQEAALALAEAYLQQARASVARKQSDRERVARLSRAYDLLMEALRAQHNSYYARDMRNQPTDQLLPGKAAEAAATLNRYAEVASEKALVELTMAEHATLIFAEKAVEYDPRNIKYLESLAGRYQRVGEQEKAIETCRKILELDPNHEAARQYLQAVGAPPSSQPTTTPPATTQPTPAAPAATPPPASQPPPEPAASQSAGLP